MARLGSSWQRVMAAEPPKSNRKRKLRSSAAIPLTKWERYRKVGQFVGSFKIRNRNNVLLRPKRDKPVLWKLV